MISIKYFTKYLPYFPIVGLGLFVFVYIYAINGYPGGSYNNPDAIGYSFFDNFLCDAMDPITKSGMVNNSRKIAIIAHLILSITMIIFFYLLPKVFPSKNINTKLIRYFGVASMVVFIFMYTSYHDLMVTLTGILGCIALVPLFIELHKYKNKRLRQLAYLSFSLSLLVFFSYETKIGFYYLPFLQKITFFLDAFFVLWTCNIVINNNKKILQVIHKK